MTLQFWNTLTRKKEEFFPLQPNRVGLYTCGPTVYDFAHIGNFRAYIFEDVLRRYLEYCGYDVNHIMNITDIDDKTIKRSTEEGLSLNDFTRRYEKAFFEDRDALKIKPATLYPRATDHIPEMVSIIKKLKEKGYTYEKDGSIYFSIERFSDYGKLSGIDLSSLKKGVRVENDEYEKEDVRDFALWKKSKPGEISYDTEIGPGRPGWHIECSAMSMKYLGETFDIHTGGVDNIFPHHENEIAQSEAFYGQKFVNYWLHCHHLVVDGEKMSKSRGNFYTLRDLLGRGIDPIDLRFFLLSTHYRKMLNFTFANLEQARASRQRILDFVYELEHRTFAAGSDPDVRRLADRTSAEFRDSLADDLNISGGLAALFEFIREVNSRLSRDLIKQEDAILVLQTVSDLDRVLAILPERKEEALPAEILEKIELRQKARKEKNFALADAIREELRQLGLILEDTKEGVRWKRIK